MWSSRYKCYLWESACHSFTARTRSNLRKQYRNNLLFSLCFYMFIVQDVVYCLLYVATVSPENTNLGSEWWMLLLNFLVNCTPSFQLSSERCFYDIKRHFIHESLSPSLCETAALVYKLNYPLFPPFFFQTNEPQNRWCVVRAFQDAKMDLMECARQIIHWHF